VIRNQVVVKKNMEVCYLFKFILLCLSRCLFNKKNKQKKNFNFLFLTVNFTSQHVPERSSGGFFARYFPINWDMFLFAWYLFFLSVYNRMRDHMSLNRLDMTFQTGKLEAYWLLHDIERNLV
jgi:hypothetical protein